MVEQIIMAEESKKVSPKMHEDILKPLRNEETKYVPHTEFEERSKKSKPVIRTGEFTPYSNVMIVCGCAY